MKTIARSLLITGTLTACALFYVALQTELYRISYAIHQKKHMLAQVQDDFEQTRVRLFKLKALGVLEKKLEAAHVDLALPTEVKTIEIVRAEAPGRPLGVEPGKTPFSLLQFAREAHAKIISSDKE